MEETKNRFVVTGAIQQELFFCRNCEWRTRCPRGVRRDQQSDPLCEGEKVHSVDRGER